MAWVTWFFAALPLLILEGWLMQWLLPAPAITLGVCLFLVLHARPGALPGLVLVLALARSVLLGGDAALQVLDLGVPVAVLVPLRAVFFQRHVLWQVAATALLATALPALGGLLGRLADAPPVAPLTLARLGWSLLLAPPAAWLLRALPPLRWFAEAEE